MKAPDRHGVLSLVLLACALAAGYAMLPVRVEPIVQLRFEKNGSAILHLQQGRQVTSTKQLQIDRLDLSGSGRFRHPRLGEIGYGEHFFMNAETRLRVLESADYRLVVSSDDGFELRIDSRPVCGYLQGRAMATQSCGIHLDAGEHELAIDYFQGGGPAGLAVRYARQDQRQQYWVGEDSPLITFHRLPGNAKSR